MKINMLWTNWSYYRIFANLC